MDNALKTLPAAKKPSRRERLSAFLREKWQAYWHIFVCALVPALIVYLIYLVRGEHPFGDGCVLVLDLNGQYVYFFEALRRAVWGDGELLYSFSRALGGEFMGIYAYYLASPFSYIVCLFPEARILEALLTIFLLKTAICGGTFGYYMHKTAKAPNRFAIILFASCYALSSYALVQQHNTMWIDAVMWLPLVTLGIESLIQYGKFKTYVIFLSLTVISNFYIGYMVCLWCFIYFFVYYLAHAEDYRNNPFHERLHFLRSLLRIALYSLLALGIAALLIFGAYYSLNFGKTTFSDPDWTVKTNFDLLDFFYKLLPCSYDTVRPEGLPFVYCGTLTILLIPAYFLSKKYSMREKILYGVLLFILYLTCSLNITDLIWHGFQAPNWLNYRYSFMISFVLCVLACRAFSDHEGLSLKSTAATGGAIAVLCVVLQTYTKGEYVDPKDFTCIYFSLLLVFVYLAVLAIFKRGAKPRVGRIALSIVLALELFLNGLLCICELDMDVGYSRYSYHNDFLKKTRPLVERVRESDDSFYRMEKTMFRKINDNMALGIRGLSGSTSTLNKETIALLEKMGYASQSHLSKYMGGTPVNDSLLGLKYIISDNPVYADYYEVYMRDPATGYVVYKNPYALSIAYGVSVDVLDFPLGFLPLDEAQKEETDQKSDEDENEIKLDGMSKLVDSLKGTLNRLFGIEESNGEVYVDAYNSPLERLNAMLTAMLGEDAPVRVFLPIKDYTVTTQNVQKGYFEGAEHGYTCTSSLDGIVNYTLTVTQTGEVYFSQPTDYPREVTVAISVNGSEYKELGILNGLESTCIMSLGSHKAGDTLDVRLTLTDEKRAVYMKTNEYYFYYIDWGVYEDAMARLASHQFKVTDYTEHSLKGTYTAANTRDLVMTTIPYDEGWEVYVDGKRVELEKAFGGLVAFYVDGASGQTHEITMVYDPPMIKIGFFISGLSLLILIALIVIDRFRPIGCRDRRNLIIVPYPEEEKKDSPTQETSSAEEDKPLLLKIPYRKTDHSDDRKD